MLQKRLYMFIVYCTILLPITARTTETDISFTQRTDIVTVSETYNKTPDLIENTKIEDLENEFVDAYEKQPPSRTEKLMLLMAPYLMKMLPYYLCLCQRITAIKLRAIHCYKTFLNHAS